MDKWQIGNISLRDAETRQPPGGANPRFEPGGPDAHASPIRTRRRLCADGSSAFATRAYWITSSAVANSVSGMVRPSALAVLRLMTVLHEQVAKFLTFENAARIGAAPPIQLGQIGAITHETLASTYSRQG